MTPAAICIQLCARLDPSSSYIYHHSQRVMIQASQGEAAQGPDIFIFLFRDLPTQTLMMMVKSTNLKSVFFAFSPEEYLYLLLNSITPHAPTMEEVEHLPYNCHASVDVSKCHRL